MRVVLILLSALSLIYGFVVPDLGRGERFSFRRNTTANKVVLVTLMQWSLIPTVYGVLALLRLFFAENRVLNKSVSALERLLPSALTTLTATLIGFWFRKQLDRESG